MQIQLKQAEIVAALKQYIHHQGINLAGKEVMISFTAGRKESGISAEMTIDEGEGQAAWTLPAPLISPYAVTLGNQESPAEDSPPVVQETRTAPAPISSLFS